MTANSLCDQNDVLTGTTEIRTGPLPVQLDDQEQQPFVSLQYAMIFVPAGMDNPFLSNSPLFLLPVGSKNLIQHQLEYVARCGIKKVDVILEDHFEEALEFVGSGERWGLEAQILRIPNDPYSRLQHLCGELNDEQAAVLLLHTDLLCNDLSPERLQRLTSEVTCFAHEATTPCVAIVTAGYVSRLDNRQLTRQALEQELMLIARRKGGLRKSPPPTPIVDGVSYLAAQKQYLSQMQGLGEQHSNSSDAGIVIGKNTTVDQTATLIPPVIIGENSCIGPGARIGPHVVIGNECHIDSGNVIENSTILPFSATGEGLQIRDSIVACQHVFNSRHRVSFQVEDSVILGDTRSTLIAETLGGHRSRAVGLLLWLWLTPVAAVLRMLLGKTYVVSQEVVQTPCANEQVLWKLLPYRHVALLEVKLQSRIAKQWADLLFRITPNLWNVFLGRIRLIGTTPKSTVEMQLLPTVWRTTLLNQPVGLITEGLIQFGPAATFDQNCTGDICYAFTSEFMRPQRQFLRYLWSLVRGPCYQPTFRNIDATGDQTTEAASMTA